MVDIAGIVKMVVGVAACRHPFQCWLATQFGNSGGRAAGALSVLQWLGAVTSPSLLWRVHQWSLCCVLLLLACGLVCG